MRHQTTRDDGDHLNQPPNVSDGHDLRARLESARRELLDLSLRNRLLNTPRHRERSSSIEVLDELAAQIFRILVTEEKEMRFLPLLDDEEAPGDADEPADVLFDIHLVQPEAEETAVPAEDEPAIAARHLDRDLQTGMTSAVLQQRLLRLYYDAGTVQEEQGINVLFLALGFLKWYEADSSDLPRYAPLILVPVKLNRRSASSRFKLRWTGEDITTNLSLQMKLNTDFGVDLPDVPEGEDLDPATYFDTVRDAVGGWPRWSVCDDDMVLWSFSFAKLMMFRDLKPETWPTDGRGLTDAPLVRQLLLDHFESEPPLWDESANLDEHLGALSTVHILDADSSQAEVIEEVRQGRSLVVQGPPGTGKSQTIANIIAAAVCEGKRVLFLAEKMAALDVVKNRLINAGLGSRDKDQCDLCLELHSARATKRKVLDELGRTLGLEKPKTSDVARQAADLEDTRARLNDHVAMMHAPDDPSGRTPFRVVGDLVALRAAGLNPAEFTLPDAGLWTPDDVRNRTRLLGSLVLSLDAVGQPSGHPWRGVMVDALLPMDRKRIADALPAVRDAVRNTLQQARELAGTLRTQVGDIPRDMRQLATFAQRLAAMPPLDGEALAHECWITRQPDIMQLVEAGRMLESAQQRLDGVAVQAAWAIDVAETRRDLAAHGGSLFRILHSAYRRAFASLRGLLVDTPPRGLPARLAILDTLIAGRAARRDVQAGDDLGRQAFGHLWSGEATDWERLVAVLEWDKASTDDTAVPEGYRQLPRQLNNATRCDAGVRADVLQHQVDATTGGLSDLFERIRLDLSLAFGPFVDDAASLELVSLDVVGRRIDQWSEDLESISNWITYRQRDEAARATGLGGLTELIYNGRVPAREACDQFAMGYSELMLRQLMDKRPALATFDGKSHEQILTEFQKLDQERIRLARQQVALAHYEAIPRGAGKIGEMGLIKHELAKRGRHLSIRKLLGAAGNAITRIKPVFMMSPMSVAQYLAPGALEFDLLLIDEASQVRPVDALGAAARAKQIVVVGDDRQLPPTRFFARSLGDVDPDDDDQTLMRAEDLESILGLATVHNLAVRMLRWHYRSQHHSLIAVSNREFYDGRLFVIPSPNPRGEFGVVLRYLPDARYDLGGSRVNRLEARLVAEAVMEHAQRFGDHSLGVGTFSAPQRDAILDELERLRREHEVLEPFFAPNRAEPFFVKNLENIQGDERDIIFMSVGYGPDQQTGRVSMNFGPLSGAGGERRLNVLVTRARQRCEVFTSMRHEDIDLGRATGLGPQAFKAYLKFAETGDLSLAKPTRRKHDSPFEASVARAIESAGYEVEAQVGEAGFFVDLAVKDPEWPGRYVLGVECDGASYHSSRWARDRDRLRQEVLERLGWTIHRIWSVDWFQRPQQQLRKAVEAIERARAVPPPTPAPPPRHDDGPLDRGCDETKCDEVASFVVPYVEASFRVPKSVEIHEMPTTQLAGIVKKIVDVESPIHGDEIAQRVTSLRGYQRTGARIRRSVRSAIKHACASGSIRGDGRFYLTVDGREIAIRDRSSVSSSTLRRPEMLPPQELRRCVLLLVERHLGVWRDEAIITTARRLGFRMTSAQLRSVIDAQIDAMIADGSLTETDGRLRLAQR